MAPELIRTSVIKGAPDPRSLSSDLLKGLLEVAGGRLRLPSHLPLLMGMMAFQMFIHSFVYLFIENDALSVYCEPGTFLGFGSRTGNRQARRKEVPTFMKLTEREKTGKINKENR